MYVRLGWVLVVGAVAVLAGGSTTTVAVGDAVSVPACHLRLPAPLHGVPRFAVPAGGRAELRSLPDQIVLCSLFRADGSTFAQAQIDRLRHLLEIRFLRRSGRLSFESDAAYPAVAQLQGASVSCGSPSYTSIGNRYWRQTIKWWVGKTPSYLPRSQVTQALRNSQSEWNNNINWCNYPNRSDGFSLYEGNTSSGLAKNGMNTVDWGSISNIQGCTAAIACTYTWYDRDGAPVESDVRFSTRERWFTRSGAAGFDVQTLAAHEFGHVRQFDHVTSQRGKQYTLVMWPYFTSEDTSGRKLGRGDSLADNLHY
jgi:matrixin